MQINSQHTQVLQGLCIPGAVASSPGAPGSAWPGASFGMSWATEAAPDGGEPKPAGASPECAPGGTSSPACVHKYYLHGMVQRCRTAQGLDYVAHAWVGP